MPTTVVLGTGIIGLSTAYYLSRLANPDPSVDPDSTPTAPHTPHAIHLVEPCPTLFASASGKAAGFLAKDWFAPAVAPLGAFSFDLHRELAAEHDGAARWGWSESVSYSLDRDDEDADNEKGWDENRGGDERQEVTVSEANAHGGASGDQNDAEQSRQAEQPKSRTQSTDLRWLMDGSSRATLLADDPQADGRNHSNGGGDEDGNGGDSEHPRWLRAKRSALQAISDRSTTGQVDPLRLCQFLLAECLARGVTLHQPARATQLLHPVGDPAAPTVVRIEYLDGGAGAEADSGDWGTSPNSMSPPSEDVGGNMETGSAASASRGGMARGAPVSRSLRESGPGPLPRRGSWASPTSPPSLEGADYFAGASSTAVVGEGVHSKDKVEGEKKKEEAQNRESSGGTVDIPCDSLVIAAGCWTPRVYRTLFPNAGRIPRVTALAGHSVVLKSERWRPPGAADAEDASKAGDGDADKGSSSASSDSANRAAKTASARGRVCHAIFTGDSAGYSPELFSRLTGDIWLGGLNSASLPLPTLASDAAPDPDALATLLQTARALLGPATLIRAGLCWRPVAPTGRPVLARVHDADLGDGARVPGGVFVATGHGPWGISLSLGTGWVVAEMVLGRETSVDVSALGRWEAQAP